MGMLSVIRHAPRAVIRAVGKTGFAFKKAKPQILVYGGAALATGAFLWIIFNARKLDDTIASGNEKVDTIQQKKESIVSLEDIDEAEKKNQLKDIEKELNKAKAESVWNVFLLIGLPTMTFLGGIGMTIGGHRILFERFGQVSALLAATQESFRRYRLNNIAENGLESDKRCFYGIKETVDVPAKITDENGKEKEVTCKVPVVDKQTGCSIYTFEFSERTSRKCPRDPVNTISFLQSQEKYWNMYMKGTGKPVTLSMVIDELGIELDPDDPANDYILIAGWRPNGEGDNEINFGIMRAINKKTLSMEDNVVILNMNCDGNIYHSVRYTKDGKKVGK